MELRTHGDFLMTEPRAKVDTKRRRRRVNWTMITLVVPMAAWMIFFFGIPQLFMIFTSFMSQGDYGGVVHKFTWSNYAQLFSPVYAHVIWSSLTFAFWVTILCLVVGYPFAYAIATASPRRKVLLLFLVIIPFWTSQLIRTFALMFMINTSGLINTVLLDLHLISQPLNLLYTQFAVYLGQFYTMLPYMILPLYAAITSYLERPELTEAAYDLGSNSWRTFWRVTFPLTSSGIAVGTLLVFIPTLGTFFIPLLMGGGRYVLVGNFISDQFLTNDNWPFGASSAIGVTVITLLLIAVLLKFMKNAFVEES